MHNCSITALMNLFSAEQADCGAVVSYIDHQGRLEADYNGFVTALVLRTLRILPFYPELEPMRSRALDFLENCASPHTPGAFAFWPADFRPLWGQQVSEDVDDTAVLTLELAAHGRRTPEQVQHTLFDVVMPALITDVDPYGPPWIRTLVFPTWLGKQGYRYNPVDCCVNANVLALLRHSGMTHLPGYSAACKMITAGLEWATKAPGGQSLARLGALTPYYPNPHEFLRAIRHAISCGVSELQSAEKKLTARLGNVRLSEKMEKVVCGRAYGRPYWFCPALSRMRELISQAGLSA